MLISQRNIQLYLIPSGKIFTILGKLSPVVNHHLSTWLYVGDIFSPGLHLVFTRSSPGDLMVVLFFFQIENFFRYFFHHQITKSSPPFHLVITW
jgi:hypothetical protein